MHSTISLAFLAASVVYAQTWTDCNPLKTTCPPNSAVGKAGVFCDFAASGACPAFHTMPGTPFRYETGRGALAEMTAPKQAPTIRSNQYLFFGRVDVAMQAAAGAGIVSSFVLQADDLDELDFEMVGSDAARVQTNYFSKGNDTVFDRGRYHDVASPLAAVRVYSIVWTRDRIAWLVDDVTVRELYRKDVHDFPQAPAQVKLGAWVAGFKGQRPGTLEWAGGEADFSDGPRTAVYKSVRIVDYAGGDGPVDSDVKEYIYSDHSGSAESIRVVLNDGTELRDKKHRVSPAPSSKNSEAGMVADSSKDGIDTDSSKDHTVVDSTKTDAADDSKTTIISNSTSPEPTTITSTSGEATKETLSTTSSDHTTVDVASSFTKVTQAAETGDKAAGTAGTAGKIPAASKIPSSGASTVGAAVGTVALLVASFGLLSGI